MRIIFMGTPDFSVPALDTVLQAGHEVVAVYTKAPSPAGRGKEIRKTPVHIAAEKKNIPVKTPASLKGEPEQKEFAEFKADIAIVVAYGLLLPEKILEAPKLGCINIHASVLPRWRGAAPIQRAIMEGDKESGVTIMQMDKGLDTGDMLAIEKLPITEKTTAKILHDELSKLGASMLPNVLKTMENGIIGRIEQPEEGVTYAKKLTKEDEIINWNDSAFLVHRKIMGLGPRPGAYFTYKGEKIKILESEIERGTSGAPGTVVDEKLSIACKDGILKPKTMQREGKAAMPTEALLNGLKIVKGEKL